MGTFAQISTSGTHTCALMAAGSLSCWGENYVGQLGIGARTLTGLPVPSPARVPNLIGTWVTRSLGIVDSVFT